jgi:hypothetical protein
MIRDGDGRSRGLDNKGRLEMLRTPTHPAFVAGFATLALAIGAAPEAAEGERLYSIPPGLAQLTVNEWSFQSGLQVLFDFTALAGVRTRGVVGTLTPLDALGALLRDTNFTYGIANSRSVVVVPGTQWCRPWLGADAPLPPCVPGLQGGTL